MTSAITIASNILFINPDIDAAELNTLTFLCQVFHIAKFKQPIISDTFLAYSTGPTIKYHTFLLDNSTPNNSLELFCRPVVTAYYKQKDKLDKWITHPKNAWFKALHTYNRKIHIRYIIAQAEKVKFL